MKVCKAKHEMPEGNKFCPECGAPPQAGEPEGDEKKEMVKACTSCAHEQPASAKFCAECGETLTKGVGEADYDAALSGLDAIAQANRALEADIQIDPSDDALNKAAAPGGDPDDDPTPTGEDVAPMIDALLKANNILADYVMAIGREVRLMRRDQGVVAAAQKTIAQHHGLTIKSLTEGFDAMANGSRAPKSRLAAVQPVAKSVAGIPESDGSPRGRELLMKARIAHASQRLTADDITRAQTWINGGATSLAQIEAQDREFGERLRIAIEAA